MSYQVESYDGEWNEIKNGAGNLLYWANKRTRQIYRVDNGYVSGPINKFLGSIVTDQFDENDIKIFCGRLLTGKINRSPSPFENQRVKHDSTYLKQLVAFQKGARKTGGPLS